KKRSTPKGPSCNRHEITPKLLTIYFRCYCVKKDAFVPMLRSVWTLHLWPDIEYMQNLPGGAQSRCFGIFAVPEQRPHLAQVCNHPAARFSIGNQGLQLQKHSFRGKV